MSEQATATAPAATSPPPAAPAIAPAPGAAAGTGVAQPAATQPSGQPSMVSIPLEQLQTFTAIQTRLAQLEADNRQKEQQAQADQAAILAKKGEVEQALNLLQRQSEQQLANERAARAATEDRAKRYATEGELSRALAAQPLVPGAAAQLTKLWRSEFTAEPQGDSFQVRTPTFKSVADFVSEQLATPDYAHFIRAQNPAGGTGGVNPAGQAPPTPAAQTAPAELPKTLSEAVILTMRDAERRPEPTRRKTWAPPWGCGAWRRWGEQRRTVEGKAPPTIVPADRSKFTVGSMLYVDDSSRDFGRAETRVNGGRAQLYSIAFPKHQSSTPPRARRPRIAAPREP